MKFWIKFKQKLKEISQVEKNKILKDVHWEKENPQVFSQSFAFGVFIGSTPLIGFHTIVGYIWARMLKKNFLAVFAGSCIPTGTPLQMIFTYFLEYKVGLYLLGYHSYLHLKDFKKITDFYILSKEIIKPLWYGSVFIAIIAGVITYFIVLLIIRSKQKKLNKG
ncbi:MAG: DUF2062 domain-containing protein [Candidatus Omnitrophica bacterium]|nr:DUF2062 domain-containing protein [Candidatus Omnitrophota bacterium]